MSIFKQTCICLFVLAAAFGGWYVYNDPQLLAAARSALPVAEAREVQPDTRELGRAGRRSGVRGRGGAMNVIAADVEQDRTAEVLVALGTAKANRSVSIFAQVTGIVEDVAFTPGEAVEAGALLVRLDDEEQVMAVERPGSPVMTLSRRSTVRSGWRSAARCPRWHWPRPAPRRE